MRFLLSIILLCSLSAQAQNHGGWYLIHPIGKSGNLSLQRDFIAVNAGADQSTTSGTINLAGGATNINSPSDVLSYHWSLISPPETVGLSSVTTTNTTATVTNSATYRFRLFAYDPPWFNYDDVLVNVAPVLVTNQPPAVTATATQTINENGTNTVSFVVSDDTTTPGSISLVVSSSNTNLVPNAALVLGGSGANRTLTATSNTHSNGVAVISITPIDAQLLPGTTVTYTLNVSATNDPPTISTPPPQTTAEDTAKTVGFTVGDIETPAGNILCSASSSDLSKVLNSQITLGGSGANRTVMIQPVTNATGTVTITIRASDGLIVTTTSFVLTITPVNDGPTLATISDVSTVQDVPVTIALDAADVDSTLTSGSFSVVSSSNPTLMGTGNVSFGGSVGAWAATLSPLSGQTGTSAITVRVSDGSLSADQSFLLTVVSSQFSIPASRVVDWSLAGIPGGIPTVSTQFCNIKTAIPGSALTAKGDGVTDDSAAIVAALALCPSNQFILFPAGTYLKTGLSTMRSGVVFRGDGMGKSRILGGTFDFTASGIDSYKDVNMNGAAAVLAKGASNVVVQSSALSSSSSPSLALAVGQLICIGVTNDLNLVDPVGFEGSSASYFSSFPNKNLGQMAEITAISAGTNLTFWPPSVWNYSNSLGVVVRVFSGACRRAGIEDMTLEPPTPQTQDNMVLFNGANQCWLKNVRIPLSYSQAVFLRKALRCEMRGCYLEHTKHSASNGGYGFEAILLPSWNLIEDNIIEGLRVSIGIEGGSGNVGSFNYIPWNTNNVDVLQKQLMFHACSPAFNLFEGNKSTSSGGDNTFGSSIFNTYFRNYIYGINPKGATSVPTTQYNWAVRLDARCIGYNFVGNVFGTPGMTGVYESSSEVGTGTRAFGTRYIYTIGYPDDGASTTNTDSGFAYDRNVRSNVLRMVNYDYVNNATVSNANLSASLHLSSKPSWFGSLTWPPIGPDVTGKTNTLPAEQRYLAMVGPSFSLTDKTGSVSTPVVWTLSVNAPDNEFFTVAATSSNSGLIPSGSIVVTGVGTNRTVTMTPVSGASGSATVTITVDDGRFTATHALTYTVPAQNTPPTITTVANQSIAQNTSTAALAFTVGDAETSASALTVRAVSSNTTLLPTSNIAISGSGASKTVTCTPVVGQTGSATCTLIVSDGVNNTSMSFGLTVTSTGAHSWHVQSYGAPTYNPDGTFIRHGNGSQATPYDAYSAAENVDGNIQPGDTVWLHGGTYPMVVKWTTSGSSGSPLIVRNWNHEQVVLDGLDHQQCKGNLGPRSGNPSGNDQSDGVVLWPACHYVWFWGLEIKATPTTRRSTASPSNPPDDSSFPPDIVFPSGIDGSSTAQGDGSGNKFIHCIVHNTQQGFGLWEAYSNNEVYGCISALNGFDEYDRGHGHCYYSQNSGNNKSFLENVAWSGFANGMQVFGKSTNTFTSNYLFEGNVIFNNGELAHNGFASGWLLYTYSQPVHDCWGRSNVFYYPFGTGPSFDSGGPGDESGAGSVNVTNISSWIVGRVKINNSPGPITFSGNSIYSSGLEGFSQSDFPSNTYYGSRPTSSATIYRKVDKYEAKRGRVIRLNWANESSFTIDPSLLGYVSGDSITLYSATDWAIGHSLFNGTYIGGTITVNKSAITLYPVIGLNPNGSNPSNPSSDIMVIEVTNGYLR